MRRSLLGPLLAAGMFALTFLVPSPASAQEPSPAHANGHAQWTGNWHGTLNVGPRRLRLQLTLRETPDGTLAGDLESLDQAPGQRISLTTLTVSEGQLSFALPAKRIRYVGKWDADAQYFAGTFRQGADIPLILRRGRFAALPRLDGLDGSWEGITRRNGVDMPMALHVSTDAEGTSASFDAPDMLAANLPVTALSRQGNQIRLTLPTANVSFTGEVDGERLWGRWSDGSESDFRRRAAGAGRATVLRPQTPVPPFPYRAIEVAISHPTDPDVILSGTLTLPDTHQPVPAAILITGSGPQDRDESAFGHKPFAVLADHLARKGIAVLRYDDRGTGRSTGKHSGATSTDFATDALAAFQWLEKRPEIDSRAIGYVGHSEGGLVGLLAAQDNPQLAYLVMLAGPGVPVAELLDAQHRALGASQGLSLDELESSLSLQADLIRIAAGPLDEDAAKRAMGKVLDTERIAAMKLPPDYRDTIRRKMLDPWFRQFVRHDPAPLIARLRQPLLAMNGSLDRQVLAKQNLSGIRQAAKGNDDITLMELPGLNHLFQTARTGSLGEYASIEETMAPVMLDAVSDWITTRFPGEDK